MYFRHKEVKLIIDMRKIIWFVLFIVLLALSSEYSFDKEREEKAAKKDTIVSTKHNKDTMYYVVNYNHDTLDWWGYYSGQPISKKEWDTILRRVDSFAFYFGYTPYIGYTLLNPGFWDYFGKQQ